MPFFKKKSSYIFERDCSLFGEVLQNGHNSYFIGNRSMSLRETWLDIKSQSFFIPKKKGQYELVVELSCERFWCPNGYCCLFDLPRCDLYEIYKDLFSPEVLKCSLYRLASGMEYLSWENLCILTVKDGQPYWAIGSWVKLPGFESCLSALGCVGHKVWY